MQKKKKYQNQCEVNKIFKNPLNQCKSCRLSLFTEGRNHQIRFSCLIHILLQFFVISFRGYLIWKLDEFPVQILFIGEGKQKIRLGPLMEIPALLKLPFNFQPRESKGNWQGKNSILELRGIFHFLRGWIQTQVSVLC